MNQLVPSKLLQLLVALTAWAISSTGWAQSSPSAGPAEPDASVRAPAGPTPPWQQDGLGRTFRIGFDPGSRWLVGGAWAPSYRADLDAPAAGLIETGVQLRHGIDADGGGVRWKLQHQILHGRAWLADRGPRLSAELYRLRFMRWSADGRIMLPTSPPHHLPFPLDVGLEASVGRVRYVDAGRTYRAEIGVLDALVLLDPWRQREARSHLSLGLGPSYRLRLGTSEQEGSPGAPLGHVVAPFSAAALGVHHESRDGHHSFDARADLAWALHVDLGWRGRAELVAAYEVILLAINDLPLSGFSELSYRYEQQPLLWGAPHELRVLAGARFAVPLR